MQEETVRKRDVILNAVGFAAETFLRAQRLEDVMDEVLAALGRSVDTSRLHIYRTRKGESGEVFCSLIYEWASPGIVRQISNPLEQDFPLVAGGYGRWIDVLGAGETLAGLRESFPVSERQFMVDEDILSVLVIPIFVDEEWWGWIGFDECRTEREWTLVETDGLRTLAGIIGGAIQRERADEARARAERRFEALVDQIPAITYRETYGDPIGATTYISPQVEAVLGFERRFWTDDPDIWERQTHPDDRGLMLTAAEKANETLEPYYAEYRMYAKDGRVVWVRDEAVIIRDADGKPDYWQGVVYDISESRAAEELVKETEARYRTLVEQIPAVTYIDDRSEEGRLLYMSPQIETMTGHPADKFLEDRNLWLSLIVDEDRDRVIAEDELVQQTGDPFNVDYRMTGPGGGVIWIHDEAVVVSRDEGGAPLYWQGVMVDITERKRTEDLQVALDVERETSQRLRDLDDMKNTFLTAVSHDLRTPLAAILGLAITLEREDIDLAAKETQDLTRRISANARKLDRLVTDLLDLDRLSRGILEPQRHPTDVGALVRKIVNEADFLLDHPVQVEADPVVLAVDGAKVERIVENLLANAVRHTSVSTQIWVKVHAQDDGVYIAVEDAGPGVLEELREAVFEPFRQGLDGGPSPGVGIGLSLVARFAELHGGRAWVEEREGGGASFRVFLSGAEQGSTHFS